MEKLILVEGVTEQKFLGELLQHSGITPFKFKEGIQGIKQLLSLLPVLLKPGTEGIYAIITDADSPLPDENQQFQARWNSLQYQLRKAGYDAPKAMGPNGIILEAEDRPRIGVWMMPDNQRRGAIEDFISELVPAEDILWPHAQAVVEDLPEVRFKARAKQKAILNSWLAWQSEPGCSLQTALNKKLLDKNAEAATAFISWIEELFNPPSDAQI